MNWPTQPPIDPTKPVGGNFKGTFAGFVAMAITGWVAKKGIIKTCASYICVADDPSAFLSCGDAEFYIAVLLIATLGSGVNYLVTRNEQIKKLKVLWEALPRTYAEYPGEEQKSEDPKSIGMDNGNFNKR